MVCETLETDKELFSPLFGQIIVFKNEPENVRKIEKKNLTVEFKCTAQT